MKSLLISDQSISKCAYVCANEQAESINDNNSTWRKSALKLTFIQVPVQLSIVIYQSSQHKFIIENGQ